MLLRGTIQLVTNPEMLINFATTHSIISVSGSNHLFQDIFRVLDIQTAEIYLPPYEACCMEADGNLQGFDALYYGYLLGTEPSLFTAILFRALYNGKDVVLFMTKEEADMRYAKLLLNFFRETYGVLIGYPERGICFNYDPSYNHIVSSLMYLMGLMNYYEFLSAYPLDHALDYQLVLKLTQEINPYVEDRSFKEYIRFFEDYRRQCVGCGHALEFAISGV